MYYDTLELIQFIIRNINKLAALKPEEVSTKNKEYQNIERDLVQLGTALKDKIRIISERI